MKRPLKKLLMPLVLLAAAGILVLAVARKAGDPFGEGVVKVGYQAADDPLPIPTKGAPDSRFSLISAWQRAALPRAARFDPPMGGEHGALVYNAQPFWAMNAARGGNHLGDDFNGIGGMDTDLGDPVHAVADGLVIHAGEPSAGWGNIVVVAHRTADGRSLHSMYAHLDRIAVARGSLVARGTKVGTVGTAHGNYPAHLHFEMRDTDENDIGAGYGSNKLDRIDPAATVAAMRGAAPDALAPSVLAVALKPDTDPFSRLETKDNDGTERLLELMEHHQKGTQ